MDKVDFIKENKNLYVPKAEPELVDVPTMHYLMFDGQGMPEDNPRFQHAFQALYGVAYALRYLPKKGIEPAGYQDFRMPPPEGLWWTEGNVAFDKAAPSDWRWTLMLRMPSWVTAKMVENASDELVVKKNDGVYKKVRLEKFDEGRSVQIMHIGSYETETADIEKLQAYAEAHGMRSAGKHHEIYFGDPRRTRPEKLRTVLRYQVSPVNLNI